MLNKEYELLDHALGNCSCIALITYIHVGIRGFQSLPLKEQVTLRCDTSKGADIPSVSRLN